MVHINRPGPLLDHLEEKMSGGRSPKQKGTRFEVECVKAAQAHGIEAKRAWGSNGKALGLTEEVDVVIGSLTGQCKRKRAVATIYRPPDGIDLALFREDRGETLVMMRYEKFLDLLGGR
jgi:Holliday junction resolvase